MNTLVSPENTWVLMAIMLSAAGISIYLEQKYAWASKISGAVIALIFALLLVNLNIIPTSAPVFDDVVWGFAVPIAIPLLLLQANMKNLARNGADALHLPHRCRRHGGGDSHRVCGPRRLHKRPQSGCRHDYGLLYRRRRQLHGFGRCF